MDSVTIPAGLSIFDYFGPDVALTTTGTISPAWLPGIKGIYQLNGASSGGAGATGWRSAKPSRPAPSVSKLTSGGRYLINVTTAFDLVGVSLVPIAPGVTPEPPATGNGYEVVLDGNSIQAGQGGSFQVPLLSHLQQMVTDLGFTDVVHVTNVAVPGQSTSDALADVSSQVVPLFDATKKKTIFFLGEPYNGLRIGATAQEEFTRVKTYFETIKAAHPTAVCVASTPPPDNSRLVDYPPNPTFEARRQEFATLMRNARAAGVAWMNALADITAETCVDPSNATLSGDGIHYTDAGQQLYTRRVAYALREAIFAVAQPAPILKAADNYAPGAAPLTFQKPSGNHIVTSNGIVTVDGTGTTNYGNLGIDNYRLPADQEGRVIVKYMSGADRDAVIGLATTNVPSNYGDFPVGFWFGGGATLATTEAGASDTVSGGLTIGTYYALYRASNGGVYLQSSVDRVAWTTRKTFAFTSTGVLYVRVDMTGSGQLSYPQVLGFESIPGSSSGGDVGPYTGAIGFEDNQYQVNNDGTITAAANPQTGNWGGTGACTSYYLAPNTAGRLIMSVTAASTDAILGISDSANRKPYGSMRAAMWLASYVNVHRVQGGGSNAIGQTMAPGQKLSLYRNANTGIITLEKQLVGSSSWEAIFQFDFESKEALYFCSDINQVGTLVNPTVEGATPIPA